MGERHKHPLDLKAAQEVARRQPAGVRARRWCMNNGRALTRGPPPVRREGYLDEGCDLSIRGRKNQGGRLHAERADSPSRRSLRLGSRHRSWWLRGRGGIPVHMPEWLGITTIRLTRSQKGARSTRLACSKATRVAGCGARRFELLVCRLAKSRFAAYAHQRMRLQAKANTARYGNLAPPMSEGPGLLPDVATDTGLAQSL